MSGIGVISNPRSGKNRRNPMLVRRLAYILGEKDIIAEPHHHDSLFEVAQRFHDRGVEVLCVNGGDGTVHTVLSQFYRVYGKDPLPALALLRGGTMNTMARNIGLKGRPEDILGRVVSQYHADEPFQVVERNLLVVDGKHAGFLFGNGLISSFLEAYYAGGDASPWKAVKVLVRGCASTVVRGAFYRQLTRPVRVRVRADQELWPPTEYTTIGVGTMADIGLGFRPFYGVTSHPDHLHALGMACPILEIIKRLHRIRLAKPLNHPEVIDRVCRNLTLSSDEPIPYMVDGDFHVGGNEVRVEVGPRVRLIVV